jgi:hypothetical protein
MFRNDFPFVAGDAVGKEALHNIEGRRGLRLGSATCPEPDFVCIAEGCAAPSTLDMGISA